MLHTSEFISKLSGKTTYKSETIPNNKLFRRTL